MSCESDTMEMLRETGHRMTPQRMMVLTSIRHASDHLSAAEIFERVKKAYPYVDISTVYRTLAVLKDLRLVSETHMGGADAAFEWVGVERHHHLVCKACGSKTPLDHRYMERLAAQIAGDLGFQADMDHFAIFGLCRACQREESRNLAAAQR